ncbi:MAG: prepilin-type N-terminal cleavage/methylation domain-containing protein [Eubacterium sp.]|nr:prepilin-type N-terminal cleavage/methylation domain-containing protein [Eubacterium sp.]
MKKLKRKLNSSSGFSMTELLAALLIACMVMMLVGGGVLVAGRVYKEVSRKSDAQTLLATSVSTLTKELVSASNLTVNGDSCSFYSEKRGCMEEIFNDAENGISLRLTETGTGPEAGTVTVMPLVTDKTRTLGLINQISGISLSGQDNKNTSFLLQVKLGEDILEEQEVTVHSISAGNS